MTGNKPRGFVIQERDRHLLRDGDQHHLAAGRVRQHRDDVLGLGPHRPHAHRVPHRIVLGDVHEGQTERDEHQPSPEILAVRYFHITLHLSGRVLCHRFCGRYDPLIKSFRYPCGRAAWSRFGAVAATA